MNIQLKNLVAKLLIDCVMFYKIIGHFNALPTAFRVMGLIGVAQLSLQVYINCLLWTTIPLLISTQSEDKSASVILMNLISLAVLNEIDRLMAMPILVIIRGYTKWFEGQYYIMEVQERESMYFKYYLFIVVLITLFNITHQMITLNQDEETT